MKKNSSKLIITACVMVISYVLILFSSKIIRSLFLPPKILESKIIGFAQYYGHSFSFDYLFLYAVIFTPIVIIILFDFIFKIYDAKS